MQLGCLRLHLGCSRRVEHPGNVLLGLFERACPSPDSPYTPSAFFVYRRLVLVVVRRSDATVEAHYHGNDRAQNDQDQLNDLPSRGTSTPMLWFRREKFHQQWTQPRKLRQALITKP
jgi:hypothetical protein